MDRPIAFNNSHPQSVGAGMAGLNQLLENFDINNERDPHAPVVVHGVVLSPARMAAEALRISLAGAQRVVVPIPGRIAPDSPVADADDDIDSADTEEMEDILDELDGDAADEEGPGFPPHLDKMRAFDAQHREFVEYAKAVTQYLDEPAEDASIEHFTPREWHDYACHLFMRVRGMGMPACVKFHWLANIVEQAEITDQGRQPNIELLLGVIESHIMKLMPGPFNEVDMMLEQGIHADTTRLPGDSPQEQLHWLNTRLLEIYKDRDIPADIKRGYLETIISASAVVGHGICQDDEADEISDDEDTPVLDPEELRQIQQMGRSRIPALVAGVGVAAVAALGFSRWWQQ